MGEKFEIRCAPCRACHYFYDCLGEENPTMVELRTDVPACWRRIGFVDDMPIPEVEKP